MAYDYINDNNDTIPDEFVLQQILNRWVILFHCHTNIQKNYLQYSYRITKNN